MKVAFLSCIKNPNMNVHVWILHMIEYPENFICIFMCPNFNFTIIWKCNLNVNLELLVSSNREYI